MNAADIRKIKKLAGRLGVHDSDIVRFAVKTMLSRLEPLHDPEARGRSLLPVFVESGTDIVRFFDLDAGRLDLIINEGVENARRIERTDIALIALYAMQPPYAAIRLSEIRLGANESVRLDNAPAIRPNGHGNGHANGNGAGTNGPAHAAGDGSIEEVSSAVRKYLYDKYMYQSKSDHGGRVHD
jgi:hypothetical protein